jgi:HSP20 family protein
LNIREVQKTRLLVEKEEIPMSNLYNSLNVFDRFNEVVNLAREFEDKFGTFRTQTPDNTWGLFEGDWSPRLDLFENDDAYFLKVDVPGVNEKDLELSLTNDVLTLKGKRDQSVGEKRGRRYQREERVFGSFQRTIPIPAPVNSEHIDANLKDGVLYITLSKREETKPKRISVSVS